MANALKTWREKSGMKLAEAAGVIGVTPPMLWRWENGTRRVPAERVGDIAQVSGIPRHELRPDIFEATR